MSLHLTGTRTDCCAIRTRPPAALRIGPVLAFAPPFTLTRVPAQLRVLFSLAVAAVLVAGHPEAAAISDYSAGGLVACALRELLLGSLFVLAFQLTFAALYMAGRTIDIQAGLGLAMVIDPTTKARSGTRTHCKGNANMSPALPSLAFAANLAY